eukprot:491788-Prymnesium_polylepis.1
MGRSPRAAAHRATRHCTPARAVAQLPRARWAVCGRTARWASGVPNARSRSRWCRARTARRRGAVRAPRPTQP